MNSFPLICPDCGAEIGRVIDYKGDKAAIDDGKMVVFVGIWNCHICKRSFHWHGDRYRFEDLLANYLQKRKGQEALNAGQ